jgi:hypothetical protein
LLPLECAFDAPVSECIAMQVFIEIDDISGKPGKYCGENE